MDEMLQLSQLVELSETSATWLSKRLYASSQGLVDDLLAHIASLNAQMLPEDLYEVMLLAAESFRTASPLHVEYRIQHPSLGDSWLKANFMPDMQEDDTLLWHGIITEATKYKHMENVLEHLYKALDSLTDPVFVKDREHRWVFLNDACCQMFGHERDELIGKTDFDFFPEHEAKIFWEKDEVVFNSGQENISEENLTDSGGNQQTILTKKTRYTDSNWQHFLVGIISNITERKRMEALLENRERGFRAMIEYAPDNIARYDRDLRILNVNPALEKTLGQPVSALIGRRTDELYPDSPILSEYYKVLQQVVNTGQVAEHLMVGGQDGFGRPLYDSIRIAPEIAVDGSVQGVIAIGRDLSLTRQLEVQVAASERELRTLIDNTPDIIIRYDLDCRRTWMNENYEQISGNPASAALGKKPTESWGSPRMAPEEYERLLREVMLNGKPSNIELNWFTSDKEYVCYSVRVVPEYDAKGEMCSVLTFGRDVSELKRAGLKTQASEQEFRTLVEHSPNMTVRYNRECRRVFVNPAYEKATGFNTIEALGGELLDSWVPENISSEAYKALLQQVMESGEPTNIILEWTELDGALVSHDMRVVPEYDVNGKPKGTLVIGHNISRLRCAEIELTKREQEFRVLVEHSPDTINRYDRECRRIYANPSMQTDAGVPMEVLMYKTPEEFPGGEQASAYQNEIRKVLNSGVSGQFEFTWRTFSGKEMCSHIHLTPEFDAEDKVISVLAVGRDITEIDEYRKQIQHLAYFDPLTYLPNRSLLSDRVREAVDEASNCGHQFGLMTMDLDRFKEINDTLGHSVGDKVLREAAERLQSCVRDNDTVARLGGDEFAILLPEIYSGMDLDTIACKILVAFNHPFIVDGCELFITTSIGIALYPNDSADVETLFRYADSAMYHAKQQGRNNHQFYSAELTEK
ncbi:MAG: PAS domain-containing protein, partial [Methylotenera sp.]|nr:PAS domain-containing protein [Methylotenera sp.]